MGESNDERGVDKNKSETDNLRSIIDYMSKTEKVTESDLTRLLGLEKTIVDDYINKLQEKGVIEVKKRFMKEPDLILRKKPPTDNDVKKDVNTDIKDAEKPIKEVENPEKKVETPEKAVENPGKEDPTDETVDGAKIIPESEEEFKQVCQNLTTDFIGLIRLSSEIGEESYSGGLLIYKGDVLAVTFEHLDNMEVSLGQTAMESLTERFKGTKGDLEIYTLSEESLETALEEEDAVLKTPVKLSSLNIKIKSRGFKPDVDESKSVTDMLAGLSGSEKQERLEMLRKQRGDRINKLNLTGNFSLVDFARNLSKLDPIKAQRLSEIRAKRMGAVKTDGGIGKEDRIKAGRVEELKTKRASRLKLRDVLNTVKGMGSDSHQRDRDNVKIKLEGDSTSARPVKKVMEGVKVHTSIDTLYDLVEKHGKVKISDALASSLKVAKTQIEEWAMILEEHDLLELKYPTIGEPEMYSKKQEEGEEDGS